MKTTIYTTEISEDKLSPHLAPWWVRVIFNYLWPSITVEYNRDDQLKIIPDKPVYDTTPVQVYFCDDILMTMRYFGPGQMQLNNNEWITWLTELKEAINIRDTELRRVELRSALQGKKNDKSKVDPPELLERRRLDS